jgi:hypothetical protein
MIKHHVKHLAYPCQEANGLVFTYMGPKESTPLFPRYEWLTVPADHLHTTKMFNECNWLQALEGDCDSAHLYFLHRRANWLTPDPEPGFLAPTFDLETTRWGVVAHAVRPGGAGRKYLRTNLFVMPCIGIVPIGQVVDGVLDGFHTVYQVPADDYTTTRYHIQMKRSGPIASAESRGRTWRGEVDPSFRKIANRSNDYLIDRQRQRAEIYSGIDFGNNTQDACVTETMGPITDRTREHLGVSDSHVVAVRQYLLEAVAGFQRGEAPPGLAFRPEENDFSDIYCLNTSVAEKVSAQAMMRELSTARA